ncbi:MAG: hypothetical protein DRN59_01880 [Thaumarchaeota archaeon]|nr:MAG: hypothetical protein DRN59_01880 [Nitrososphaerota archaeon]
MRAKTRLGSAERYFPRPELRDIMRELSCSIAVLPIEVLRPHKSLILDDHHRVEALRRLGCKNVRAP